MSRASRRRESRSGESSAKPAPRNWAPLWIMSGSVVAALIVLGVITQRGDQAAGDHHPTPRVNATQLAVMPAARYSQTPRTAQVYQMASEVPQVLDGMFCYCFCARTLGHYSLLDCFREDHAADCDVCQNEAVMAYEMTQRGESIDAIRRAIDQQYRT
jgi:Protein of unknown function with PCYCGC motif